MVISYFFLLFRWVRYYQCWRHSQATKKPYWDLSWATKRYMLLEVYSGESDEVLIVCYGQAYTMGKSPNRCYPSSPVLGSRILLVTLYTPLFWHRSKTQQPHKKGYTLLLEPGVWGCYTYPQSITSSVPESICWHTEWLRTALNMYHLFCMLITPLFTPLPFLPSMDIILYALHFPNQTNLTLSHTLHISKPNLQNCAILLKQT